MTASPGTLTFFAGKMGAGKSTRAKQIAEETGAILLCEDRWLAQLYPDQIRTVEDYQHFSGLIKPLVRDIAQSVLKHGQSIVLDYPANTVRQRAWLKSLGDEVSAPHILHHIDIPDHVCLERIKKRANPHTDTEAMFDLMGQYFEMPSASEGLNIILTKG